MEANTFKTIRSILNLTQSELAKRLDISTNMVAKIETGERNVSLMQQFQMEDMLSKALQGEDEIFKLIKEKVLTPRRDKPLKVMPEKPKVFKIEKYDPDDCVEFCEWLKHYLDSVCLHFSQYDITSTQWMLDVLRHIGESLYDATHTWPVAETFCHDDFGTLWWIGKNGERVRADDMTPEEKEKAFKIVRAKAAK